MRRPRPVELMLGTTVLLWALNATVTRYALTHGWQPLAYSAIRYAAAASIFLAITTTRERSVRVPGRRDLVLVALAAGIGIWVNQLAFVYAIKLTNASTVSLLFGVTPIVAALGALAVGVERASGRFWLAAGVSFAGVALVAGGSGGDLEGDLRGILLGLAAASTWAAYAVIVTPLMRRYSPYRISTLVLLAGIVPLAATALPQLLRQPFDLGALPWLALVFAILGPLVLTNVLWFRAVDAVGPGRATLAVNLQPFLAVVIAFLVLGERLTAMQLAGGAAIAAGIALSRRRTPPVAGVD